MSKFLGQNFLTNKNKIIKIINSLNIKEGDLIIEIGPGKGALTREINNNFKKIKLIGIEKDRKLADSLKDELAIEFLNNKNELEIIEGDALKKILELTKNIDANFKILGNIPYYITGQLFRVFEKIEDKPELIVLMVQKEVAERVSAKPPKMNILASSVQVWADVKIIDYVPKNNFKPVPKVDSAVIKLTPKNKPVPKNYYETVKSVFKHPRKTLLNNLYISKNIEKEVLIEKLKEINIEPKIRPENLNIAAIKKIALML